MKRALISDFDGTIYFVLQDPPMSEEDLQAIRSFQAQGGLFGICTGRSLKGILTPLRELGLRPDFSLCASGALVVDREGNVLQQTCIDEALAQEVYVRYHPRTEGLVFQARDSVYSFGPPLRLIEHIDALSDLENQIYGFSFRYGTPQEAAAGAAEVNRLYPALSAFQNVRNVDIVPRGCSKGTAVKTIRKVLGIDRIAGIGDSYNDLPLLDAADVSYTFERAPEDLQAAADHVVHSAAEAIGGFELEQL